MTHTVRHIKIEVGATLMETVRTTEDPDRQRSNGRPYAGGRRPQDQLSQYSDSRREQRLAIKFSIWAPSPTEEELRNRSPSPDREVKKKPASKAKSKKPDSDSESDTDRKRRRKSSKSSKHKRSSRSDRKSSRRSKKRSRTATPSSESDDEKHHSRKSKRREASGSRSPSPVRHRSRRSASRELTKPGDRSPSAGLEQPPGPNDIEIEYPDDMWVEKKVEMPDDDQAIGPVPLQRNDGKMNERSYGGALLAGEGSAMAAYVQEGKRIPRRGEIGLHSGEIEGYETAGFVMSGSRHQRMNAVRVRKENQVISAEEKRALMLFNQEEKIKKDNKIINEMREMVASKLRSTGHSV
ncbi:hypothetical protein BGX31_011596 [Mortierella sp. GBA43]|nr:hypothetical protein BGX31_011596 [Mortierella sp. GBA43]